MEPGATVEDCAAERNLAVASHVAELGVAGEGRAVERGGVDAAVAQLEVNEGGSGEVEAQARPVAQVGVYER